MDQNNVASNFSTLDVIEHVLEARAVVISSTPGVSIFSDKNACIVLAERLQLLALIWNGDVFLGLLSLRNPQVNDDAATGWGGKLILHGKTFR
jgi:hypothetical protein